MISFPLKTVVIGFGKIGSGYADDEVMARYYQYASHSQALVDHPAFDWVAVVDPAKDALNCAATRWKVPLCVEDVLMLGDAANNIEVAIIATPPDSRIELLDQLPALKAILVEKPLGNTLAASHKFLQACHDRNILVQVNLWRRADEKFRSLAKNQLQELIGESQLANGVYGNGVLNNGTHMVDFSRMLFGEIESVQAFGNCQEYRNTPIKGDLHPKFFLNMERGLSVSFQPLDFNCYRENGLDIWGTNGRFSIYNEGLTLACYSSEINRAMKGEKEIECDSPSYQKTTVGRSLYRMYTNLADTLDGKDSLWSSGASALRSSAVIEAILRSNQNQELIMVDDFISEYVSANEK
jgi:predicted dehydrogenase